MVTLVAQVASPEPSQEGLHDVEVVIVMEEVDLLVRLRGRLVNDGVAVIDVEDEDLVTWQSLQCVSYINKRDSQKQVICLTLAVFRSQC